MTTNLLIRRVPEPIRNWIDEEKERWKLSQQEFVLRVLERAFRDADQGVLFEPKVEVPATTPSIPNSLPFTFVDLFAGIGGLRLGLEAVGGRCIWSSEWDRHAQKTYAHWYGEVPEGDITAIPPKDIPDHDILAAGFPCQPFSIAGVSKKNALGHAHGFKCERQGNLFFTVADIIAEKRPPVLLLENVKNLRSHDKGRTWKVISSTLREELGYTVFDRVIDAAGWVPQHRERIFIVGFDRDVFGEEIPFSLANVQPPAGPPPRLRDILMPRVDPKYTLTDHLWNYLQEYAAKHKAKGNGFGYGLADRNGISRTLSARYYKDGSEILIPQSRRKNPRRLTPTEAARLMGFCGDFAVGRGYPSGDFPIVVSDTQAYKQFGNSVSPPVVAAVAHQVSGVLQWQLGRHGVSSLGRRSLASTRHVG